MEAVIAQKTVGASIVRLVHVGAITSLAKVVQRSKGSDANIVHGTVASVAKVVGKGASIASIARIRDSQHASDAAIIAVDDERAAIAPVAGVRGSEHAAVAQILFGFFPDAEVFRGKLSVRTQYWPVKGRHLVSVSVHAGPRSIEGGSSAGDGFRVGAGLHGRPRRSKGHPPHVNLQSFSARYASR